MMLTELSPLMSSASLMPLASSMKAATLWGPSHAPNVPLIRNTPSPILSSMSDRMRSKSSATSSAAIRHALSSPSPGSSSSASS